MGGFSADDGYCAHTSTINTGIHSCSLAQMVENMELAFITWNRYPGSATGEQTLPDEPGWAEWVVRRPSVVGTVSKARYMHDRPSDDYAVARKRSIH